MKKKKNYLTCKRYNIDIKSDFDMSKSDTIIMSRDE